MLEGSLQLSQAGEYSAVVRQDIEPLLRGSVKAAHQLVDLLANCLAVARKDSNNRQSQLGRDKREQLHDFSVSRTCERLFAGYGLDQLEETSNVVVVLELVSLAFSE